MVLNLAENLRSAERLGNEVVTADIHDMLLEVGKHTRSHGIDSYPLCSVEQRA
jgi:hypothetical protein